MHIIKKMALVLTNSVWTLSIVGTLFAAYGTYLMYNSCYDQTKDELVEKISKETDERFRNWVTNYLQERHPGEQEITVCVSKNDLVSGALVNMEHACLIFIKGDTEVTHGIWSKIQHAEHVPILVIRPQYQEAILEHLSDTHECDTTCKAKQNSLKAALDHEYAHIHNHDLITVLTMRTIGLVIFTLFGLLLALLLLWYGYHNAYIISPYITSLAVACIINTHSRYLEQRCDQAICNDVPTLHGFVAFLDDINQLQKEAIDQNSSWVAVLPLRAEHEDGFWGSAVWGSHPPVNKRIAQIRERINALEAAA